MLSAKIWVGDTVIVLVATSQSVIVVLVATSVPLTETPSKGVAPLSESISIWVPETAPSTVACPPLGR